MPIFCMFGSVVDRVNEQQELLLRRDSLQCCDCLCEPEPECSNKIFHVLIDRQKRIAQAIARKLVDDVN